MYRYIHTPQPDPNAESVTVAGRVVPGKFTMFATPEPGDDGPKWRMEFEVINGAPQVRAISIEAIEGNRGLRRSDLVPLLPIEDAIEEITKIVGLAVAEDRPKDGSTINLVDSDALLGSDFIKGLRKARQSDRRRGPTDDDLRLTAEIYTTTDHAPVQAVLKHFDISERAAYLWIKRARTAGYIK